MSVVTHNIEGMVGRPIIYDHQLDTLDLLGTDAVEGCGDEFLAVVRWHYN
jgi:hypothetical protein